MGLGPASSPISIFIVIFAFLVGMGFLVYSFGKKDHNSRQS